MLYISYFIDNYIDGSEFVALTLTEIKEMVPPIGLAKKIVNLFPRCTCGLQNRSCYYMYIAGGVTCRSKAMCVTFLIMSPS